MATVYVVTTGSGDSYRIERVYLENDQAYGFAQDYNGIAPVEPVQVEEWQTGPRRPPTTAHTGARSGGARPGQQASRCAAAHRRGRTVRRLRHPPRMVGPARRCPRPRWCAGTGRGTQSRGSGSLQGEEESYWDTMPRYGPTWPESRGNSFRYFVLRVNTNGHGNSTLPPWCVMIEPWMNAPWNGSATKS
jgi:hypothetical protein